MDTLELQELINQGHYSEALNSLKRHKFGDNSDNELLKAKILVYQADYDNAILILEKMLTKRKLDISKKYILYTLLGLAYFETNQIDKTKKYVMLIDGEFNDFFSNRKESDNEIDALFYRIKGLLSLKAQKFEIARMYFDCSLLTIEKTKYKILFGSTLIPYSLTFIHQGEYEEAMPLLEDAISILSSFSNTIGLAYAYNNLGGAYFTLGLLLVAKDCYLSALKLCEEPSALKLQSMVLNNLGNIYFNQGCFESAIEHYNQSLELKNKISDENGKWASYHNLGKSYMMVGDPNNGIEFLLKALQVQKTRKNQIEKSNTLVELISAYLSLNDDNMAKYYHLELYGIRNITMNKIIDLYYRYSKGLIYSFYGTDNFVNLANQEFLAIIQDDVINHEITTASLIRLCHQKILTIEHSDMKSGIYEIQGYIDQLLYLSKLNRSYSLNAEGLLLQSMINKYLEFDELSQLQWIQAELLIHEQNLVYLTTTLEQYKLEMDELMAFKSKEELVLATFVRRINNLKNHI